LENVAGIVDPGHNLYSRSDRCAWALSAQADRFLVPSASLKSCCPKKSHQENLNSSASPRRNKNLAGFGRGFRFTQQKHICAAAKQSAAQM